MHYCGCTCTAVTALTSTSPQMHLPCSNSHAHHTTASFFFLLVNSPKILEASCPRISLCKPASEYKSRCPSGNDTNTQVLLIKQLLCRTIHRERWFTNFNRCATTTVPRTHHRADLVLSDRSVSSAFALTTTINTRVSSLFRKIAGFSPAVAPPNFAVGFATFPQSNISRFWTNDN